MTPSKPLPTFEPIPWEFIHAYPQNPLIGDFELILPRAFDPRIPFGWGFTIYRAVFGEGTDTRFAEGLNRFEKWMRWQTRMSRYDNGGGYSTPRPQDIPPPGPDISDDLAARLYNEVVEEYPDAQDIITGPEGSEDFTPVALDFISRVESFNIDFDACDWDEGRRHARYDTCLVIDERVLKMLEELPEDPPEVILREKFDPVKKATDELLRKTWLWILDRETAMRIEEGEESPAVEFPPWIRIRLHSLQYLFFMRARGFIPRGWTYVVEEDKEHWDTIRWWSSSGRLITDCRRYYRAERKGGDEEARDSN